MYVCVFKTVCYKEVMETTDIPNNHVTSPYINRTQFHPDPARRLSSNLYNMCSAECTVDNS
jgi:hypothetical protein